MKYTKTIRQLFLLAISGGLLSCSVSGSLIAGRTANSKGDEFLSLQKKLSKVYYLKDDVDLQGKTLVFPDGVKIVQKGGSFKNGTLTGNNTRIDYKKSIFDNVQLEGTWNIPVISTAMFTDLSYDNSLRELLKLTNPEIDNKVIVEEGNYTIRIEKTGANGLYLTSNTELVINGIITMIPNNYKRYHIIYVSGSNVRISGNGTIIGDKDKHLGTEGQWGMGINIIDTHNCTVSGVSVKDCWGDCIYIGRGNDNIELKNLKLDNGRRQGISITSGENICIDNVAISNISGQAPAYAIDIEPNEGDKIKHVVMNDIKVDNCEGGFVISVNKNEAAVEDVVISNCKVENITTKFSLRLNGCSDVEILNSKFDKCGHNSTCSFAGISRVKMTGNTIISTGYAVNNISEVIFESNTVFGDGIYSPTLNKKKQVHKDGSVVDNTIIPNK